MKAADSDVVFDLLTPKQQRVLQQFLAVQTDEAIAVSCRLVLIARISYCGNTERAGM